MLVIVVFAAIGRRNHDESGTVDAVFTTAAPFLIGLGVAWLLLRTWRRPMSILNALAMWPILMLVGMIARNTVFDRGTASSFVVVATLFLGASTVGWRVVARLVGRARTPAT